jgi:hypothetical protein
MTYFDCPQGVLGQLYQELLVTTATFSCCLATWTCSRRCQTRTGSVQRHGRIYWLLNHGLVSS